MPAGFIDVLDFNFSYIVMIMNMLLNRWFFNFLITSTLIFVAFIVIFSKFIRK